MKPKSTIHTNYYIWIFLMLISTYSASLWALPSFARQTNMACATCHTQSFGPNLTSFGRNFKLNAYTQGVNESYLSRFGGMVMGSLTSTKKDDHDLATDSSLQGYNANNNLAFDQASLFYGGKIIGSMGEFVQFSYDGVENKFFLDNTDIRVSNETEWHEQNFVYGLSFNNSLTVQDLWNTTPAWSFPFISSTLARAPSTSPLIANIGGQVGGASFYTMINDTLFLEAGAYTSFAKYAQKIMGNWDNGAVKVDGGAPYWRIALQKEWQGHYFSLGHFGFRAKIQPTGIDYKEADSYTDLGLDFNYQYLGNPNHIYELKASYIREKQLLSASYHQLNTASAPNQNLAFLALNASYTYQQTYAITFGYNRSYGNRDSLLYENSVTNMPNSEFFTAEFDYVPFGKVATSGLEFYLNLRFTLQYIAYTHVDGAEINYDGTGRNASDNNTLYLNTSLAF